MVYLLPFLLLAIHCAALPLNSGHISELSQVAGEPRHHASKDNILFHLFHATSVLAPKAMGVFIVIVAQLAFFSVVGLILYYWPPSWTPTRDQERGPLLPIQRSDPVTARPNVTILAGQGMSVSALDEFTRAAESYCSQLVQSPLDQSPVEETSQSGSPSSSGGARGSPSRRRANVFCGTCVPASPQGGIMDLIASQRSATVAEERNVEDTNPVQGTSRPQRSLSTAVLGWRHPLRTFSAPDPSPVCRDTLANSFFDMAKLNPRSLYILAVGVTESPSSEIVLQGPKHDLEWLQGFFADQKNVTFKSLLDQQATHESIRKAMKDMYVAAQNGEYIVLYHGGHSNANNALELHANGEVITEALLDKWIQEIRREELPKDVTALIIFDSCRTNPNQPPVNLSPGVACVWASSLGERSFDTSLGPGLPHSVFLSSLFVAIHDVQTNSGDSFFTHFNSRIQKIGQAVRGILCDSHKCKIPLRVCHCDPCQGGGVCTHLEHPDTTTQTPTSSVPSDVIDIAVQDIKNRFPWQVRRVAQLLTTNHWYLRYNPTCHKTKYDRAFMVGVWLSGGNLEFDVRSATLPNPRRSDSERDMSL